MHSFFVLIATGFYTGHLKPPGTIGTIVAVFLMFLTLPAGIIGKFAFFIVLFILGLVVSEYYEKYCEKCDPSEIVVDEYAAYYLVLMFVPFNLVNIIITFFLFRVFDIFKPYPVKTTESIGGGVGIMLDDIVAAIYTLGSFYLIKVFLI